MTKFINFFFVIVAVSIVFILALVALMFILMGAIVAVTAGGLKLIADWILDLALWVTAKAADRVGRK